MTSLARLAAIAGLGILIFAGYALAAHRGQPTCATLLPKGGGTVVHGVFVPLNPGEYLQLCQRTVTK